MRKIPDISGSLIIGNISGSVREIKSLASRKPDPDKRYITDKTLAALKTPAQGRRTIHDTAAPGLSLVVTAKGSRRWFVRYQVGRGGRRTQGMLQIGDARLMPITEAREKALEYRRLASEGIDPARKPEEKVPEIRPVREVVETYFAQHAAKKLRPATRTDITNSFNCDLIPVLGERDIETITRADIRDVLKPIIARGAEIKANRTLAYLRAFFSWAASNDYIGSSPVAGIEAPAKENSRDRVLNDRELALFWRASYELGYPFAPAFQLLALTCQRREEVCAIRWSEIDLEARKWTIPADRAKNGRTHEVHLGQPALSILSGLWECAGDEPFVFSTTGRTPVSAFSKAKTRLDKIMAERNGGTPIPHWVLHDLRRTGTTILAGKGFPPHVVDKLLNHVGGEIKGVAAVYNRFAYHEERRAALEALGSHILSLTEAVF